MNQTPHNPPTASSKLAMLRQRLTAAKKLGVQIRSEWLGGETGGACEIAGKRWIFLDLSLSVEEQLGQVEDALRQWNPPPAPRAQGPGRNDAGQTARSIR